jgi:anthranilate phosphoribosyltransferase
MPELDARSALIRLTGGESLTREETEELFGQLMDGMVTETLKAALLVALRMKGEAVAEISGAAAAMRRRAIPIPHQRQGLVDTCGTGGDGSGSVNVSTLAAFIVAACGVPVAKHGNRALSSKSGSADVLTALGVDIDCEMALVQRALNEVGIAFLMAPRHHTAMRHVGPTRVELGTRTIFNLLGPLSNPAGARRQVVGVFAPQWVRPMAEVLGRLGGERAWVYHGEGLDELTTAGTSQVAELKDGSVRTFTVAPEDAGLPRASLADLKGTDPAGNAERMRAVLAGETGPLRDIVLLNGAAALIVAGKADGLKEGVRLAARSIDEGHARRVLDRLVAMTAGAAA